ncbi:hypothetical protein BH24CHL6_BH24CHL6_06960 [soil metagenome]
MKITRSGRRPLLVSVAAGSLVLILGGVTLAGSGFVPQFREPAGVAHCEPDQCGSDYHVVARAEDLSEARALAFNVVLAEGVESPRIAAIASAVSERFPETRIIVYFFGEASAAEQLGFGLLPTRDTEPAPQPVGATGWIATLDYAPNGRVREVWHRP